MFKPRPPRLDIEIMQVESQIRQLQIRMDTARMTEEERITLGHALLGQHDRLAHLNDLLQWEKECAA